MIDTQVDGTRSLGTPDMLKLIKCISSHTTIRKSKSNFEIVDECEWNASSLVMFIYRQKDRHTLPGYE